MNSKRGGSSTARRILCHGPSGFSHNSRICRGAYKHISRIAHPDKNLMRNAYYCAVADIAMEAAQRASSGFLGLRCVLNALLPTAHPHTDVLSLLGVKTGGLCTTPPPGHWALLYPGCHCDSAPFLSCVICDLGGPSEPAIVPELSGPCPLALEGLVERAVSLTYLWCPWPAPGGLCRLRWPGGR